MRKTLREGNSSSGLTSRRRHLAPGVAPATFDLGGAHTSTMFSLQQWQSWPPESDGTSSSSSSPRTAAGFLVILPLSLSPSLVSVAPGERLILDIQRIAAFVSEI